MKNNLIDIIIMMFKCLGKLSREEYVGEYVRGHSKRTFAQKGKGGGVYFTIVYVCF